MNIPIAPSIAFISRAKVKITSKRILLAYLIKIPLDLP